MPTWAKWTIGITATVILLPVVLFFLTFLVSVVMIMGAM